MKIVRSILFTILIPVLVLSGCTAVVYEYESTPVSQHLEEDKFQVVFTPEKVRAEYYSRFKLDVKNMTDTPIQIDWNQTAYLLNGKKTGRFVWAGIDSVNVKDKTIPNTVINPGQVVSKEIAPLAKVAMAHRSDYGANKDKPVLYGGILPPGENGILLAVIANGKLIRKKIVVMISEMKK